MSSSTARGLRIQPIIIAVQSLFIIGLLVFFLGATGKTHAGANQLAAGAS
jgi:hypothetical protein